MYPSLVSVFLKMSGMSTPHWPLEVCLIGTQVSAVDKYLDSAAELLSVPYS